ncbi:hypothetical protein Cfor_03909, partial [Coptotermes formosanus]
KAPSEATFRGSEYLSYDLSRTGGEPIVSAQDSISLNFKTRQPNGLLFYTGDGLDYLNLALKDGGVTLTMNLGNGRLEMQIRPNKVRFDDNQWHKVTVHRKVQEISAVTSFCRLSAVVDGVYSEHAHAAGTVTMLSSSRVYVGGSQNTHALPGSRIHSNFVGCLRKVEFTADTLKLNLIDLGRTESKLITVVGHVDFMCQEVEAADPVTFTTRDSNLVSTLQKRADCSSLAEHSVQWETFNIPHDGCVPLVGTVAISVPALIWNCDFLYGRTGNVLPKQCEVEQHTVQTLCDFRNSYLLQGQTKERSDSAHVAEWRTAVVLTEAINRVRVAVKLLLRQMQISGAEMIGFSLCVRRKPRICTTKCRLDKLDTNGNRPDILKFAFVDELQYFGFRNYGC